ncbi:MAG: DUF4115 domain-containing protein [Sphingobium sp.]|nr:DUF4115 domain-containing protein [Sphingobium sp.]MCP5398636.1 DUF4115 domain-containing protein [Sphingomonas sp.]
MDEMTPETDALMDDVGSRPGTLLREAREERGMSIAEVAEQTRVAQRQLDAIERNDFGALPGTPYAVGFARAYARAVGVDEVAIARGVRSELGALDESERYEMFEPADPARIPPRSMAWVAAGIALILAVGYGVWRTQFFSASTDQEIADLANRSQEAQPGQSQPQAEDEQPQAPAASGPVVLTALHDVWLRIYDEGGERLFEKQMAKGETYTVPSDANNPMILTGRPDALAVTIGGREVAPLGPPERTISDVPVSASALLARPATPTSSVAAPVPSPSPASSLPPAAEQAQSVSPRQPAVDPEAKKPEKMARAEVQQPAARPLPAARDAQDEASDEVESMAPAASHVLQEAQGVNAPIVSTDSQ